MEALKPLSLSKKLAAPAIAAVPGAFPHRPALRHHDARAGPADGVGARRVERCRHGGAGFHQAGPPAGGEVRAGAHRAPGPG